MDTTTDLYNGQKDTKVKSGIKIRAISKCPHCGTSFNGYVVKAVTMNDDFSSIDVLHYCASCNKMFLSLYQLTKVQYQNHIQNDMYTHKSSLPNQKFTEKEFSKDIKLLSPSFVEIYNQSLQAETLGLTEICGIGYRKALEFLIKDYCKSISEENQHNSIEKSALANCIKTYVQSVDIETLASRCAWVGNDETHYVRKHENLDFNDMKEFIDATVYYISMKQIYNKAISITPK